MYESSICRLDCHHVCSFLDGYFCTRYHIRRSQFCSRCYFITTRFNHTSVALVCLCTLYSLLPAAQQWKGSVLSAPPQAPQCICSLFSAEHFTKGVVKRNQRLSLWYYMCCISSTAGIIKAASEWRKKHTVYVTNMTSDAALREPLDAVADLNGDIFLMTVEAHNENRDK